ncbi:MAG: tetratricopeptide repeat protein [Rhizobiales bacterium]|nr:tetratricopeptide repeat protein [Hyphomicrobiales bacterium]
MRVLAGVVLAAAAVFTMTPAAQAEAPSDLRVCLDNATPNAPRVAACSQVLTNAPPADAKELVRIYFLRGNANLALGVYDRALADFDAATRINPNAYGPFNSRGVVFLRQKQVDRAITEFDRSIQLFPKDPIAFTNRGDAYRSKGHFDRAMQDYDRAIEVNPKWVGAYFGRAAALQQKATSDFDAFVNEGSFEELAIAEYGKVLQLAPRHGGALSNRGLLYHQLRKYPLAIADFTQAIEIEPANPIFLRNRALTYRMIRRFDLAIADYRNALALTKDAEGRKLIGELLAQLGAAA